MENILKSIEEFVARCQVISSEYQTKHFPNNAPQTLNLEPGKKYCRIVQIGPGTRSAWAFVDMANGDVLKAASWKLPAKHARGNIFDENQGMKHIGPYGPAYLR